MKLALFASVLVAGLLSGSALSQTPPTDRREIPPRSIHLSLQQGHIIKENVKDMRVEQTRGPGEIRIGDKLPAGIALHDFPPLVVEKVPQVKTYRFFVTENQIVLVNPQNQIADIIK